MIMHVHVNIVWIFADSPIASLCRIYISRPGPHHLLLFCSVSIECKSLAPFPFFLTPVKPLILGLCARRHCAFFRTHPSPPPFPSLFSHPSSHKINALRLLLGVFVTQAGPASLHTLQDVYTPVHNTLCQSVLTGVSPYAIHIPSFAHMWGFCMAFKQTASDSGCVRFTLFFATTNVYECWCGVAL